MVAGDGGVVKSYFGVEHDNKLWLVTKWIIDKSTGFATPIRMIRIDSLSPAPMKLDRSETNKFDYTNIVLPKSVIEGTTENSPGFEVKSLPEEPKVHRDELFTLPPIIG